MICILASNNQGKIEEFKTLLPEFEIKTYKEILGEFDIIEDGLSFKQNAIIKAKTINDKLKSMYKDNEYIVISDDSGISVPILNNEPNIYSARYAGINSTDKKNNEKLISKLNEKNINKTSAFYTACICIIYKDEVYTTHGFLHGDVINKEIGNNGFGYDPLFIPKNNTKTLGELEYKDKKDISHRTKALNLAMKVIKTILQ